MERQFLTASIFFLLGLSSCQSNPTTSSNYDAICNLGSLNAECVNKVVISVEEPKPVAKNVWEYMIINNSYDHKIKFDENSTMTTHSRNSFVYNFLYSLRQRIDDPRGMKRAKN